MTRGIRTARRAGIEVILVGPVAIPRSFFMVLVIAAPFVFMFTCAAGDLVFGWPNGMGAKIFLTGIAVVAALAGIYFGVRGIYRGVKLFRKVNSPRSGNDYF